MRVRGPRGGRGRTRRGSPTPREGGARHGALARRGAAARCTRRDEAVAQTDSQSRSRSFARHVQARGEGMKDHRRRSKSLDFRGSQREEVDVLRVLRSKKRLSIAVGVAAVGTFAAVAFGSPGTIGFVPTTLATGNLPNKVEHNTDQVKLQTRGATDVRVRRVAFGPGASSGWHHHPGVVIVTVASGAVQFTHGCSTTTYGPGLPAGSVVVES